MDCIHAMKRACEEEIRTLPERPEKMFSRILTVPLRPSAGQGEQTLRCCETAPFSVNGGSNDTLDLLVQYSFDFSVLKRHTVSIGTVPFFDRACNIGKAHGHASVAESALPTACAKIKHKYSRQRFSHTQQTSRL